MNIYLACNAGMSTSILVKKMQAEAEKIGLDAHIEAFSIEVLDRRAADANVVLLGPQVRHMLKDVKAKMEGKCPVEVIDMRDYGTLRGDKVLTRALQLIEG